MVELQLLNLWVLKTMLKGERDGVVIIKPGHIFTGNTWFPNNDFSRWQFTHTHSQKVRSLFEECEEAFQHHPWLAQLPDLFIIESLWSVLESRVRSRFPPLSSLKQLEDVLYEMWYSIPLETIQNLRGSIPRSVPAVVQTNGDPTPY
jgi:hypothetical protein